MIDKGKYNVLGVGVDAVDYETVVSKILLAARCKEPLAVSALAVHGVMTGVGDRHHRYRLNQIDVVCPDGQPVRWALNLLHAVNLADRLYGPRLMMETCRAAAAEGLPIFLFGGRVDTLDKLSGRLLEQIPNLQIAGRRASRFRKLTPDEWDELVKEVRDSGARVLLVGLGCPRQEVFVFEVRDAVSIPTLAVGAAFSLHSGELAQAPPLMQRWGLEWLFRLVQEPRRLWRRYLYLNPAYLGLLALQLLGVRKWPTSQLEPPANPMRYG